MTLDAFHRCLYTDSTKTLKEDVNPTTNPPAAPAPQPQGTGVAPVQPQGTPQGDPKLQNFIGQMKPYLAEIGSFENIGSSSLRGSVQTILQALTKAQSSGQLPPNYTIMDVFDAFSKASPQVQ